MTLPTAPQFVTAQAQHGLQFTRTVPISPEQCWAAWTTPALLEPWFCPKPWYVTDAQIDLRPGGRFGTVMHGPNGERFDNVGCYLVVEAPRRLVWTNALAPGFVPQQIAQPGFAFTAEVLFDPAPSGGTLYSARVVHANAADCAAHAAMGFEPGWGACLDQLVAFMQARGRAFAAS